MKIVNIQDGKNSGTEIKCIIETPRSGDEIKGGLYFFISGQIESSTAIKYLRLIYQSTLFCDLKLEILTDQEAILDGFNRYLFSGHICLIGLEKKILILLRAVAVDERRFDLKTFDVVREKVQLQHKPQFAPITVNGMPRSGTTWLMHMLSCHPMILAHEEYPYERRFAIYWMHLFDVLSKPDLSKIDDKKNWAFQWGNDTVLRHPYFPWLKEYRDWFGGCYPELLATFCVGSIDSLYQDMQQKQEKESATCFVEKFPDATHGVFAELYEEYKSIILIRDFRSTYCSITSFNKKRNQQDFNRDKFESEEKYFMHLGKVVTKLVELADAKENSRKCYFLKYEDLVQRPKETLALLFRWLCVGSEKQTIERIMSTPMPGQKKFKFHMTSQSQGQSLERWRTDLPVGFNEYATDQYKNFFERFGYPLT